MDSQRVVVVVEEDISARAALEWAAKNLLRSCDSVTLLHVYPFTRSRKKQRNRRLRGFQLALSFKDLCNGVPEAKVEIIVMEGEQGDSIVSFVNRTSASTLVVGLHEQSFLYRLAIQSVGTRSSSPISCRIIAVKPDSKTQEGYINIEFSQVEIARLSSITETRNHNSLLETFFPLSLCSRKAKRKKKRRHHGCSIYRTLHHLKRPPANMNTQVAT